MRIRAVFGAILAVFFLILGTATFAAPYAAMVIDARTGEVIHSRNADTRLHPASLTKMMTLYLAFQAIESGQISAETVVTISANAAAEPPSKLGLKAGQKVKLKYLIRAAAVKSANDAATAIGEAIAGSETAFAKRMTATALQMGMTRTTFKNANGLTAPGHLSTARDMTTLGRRLFYDFPDYYNLFSRISTDAGGRSVYNTNRRFLSSYKGADGIKTGYTSAAGYNLVASAERGNKRIIATVFGGRSTAARNAQVAELLDMGFKKAPTRVAVVKPKPLSTITTTDEGQSIRIAAPRAVAKSLIPKPRPEGLGAPLLLAAVDANAIDDAVFAAVRDTGKQTEIVDPEAESSAEAEMEIVAPETVLIAPQVARAVMPKAEPEILKSTAETEAAILAAVRIEPVEEEPQEPRVVIRNADDARKWSVQLGAFRSRYDAEKLLLRTALADLNSLDGALRKVDHTILNGETFYQAKFVGLSQVDATKTCARLVARAEACVPIGPGS